VGQQPRRQWHAIGTTSWSASGITLLGGSNVITITARDAAGNTPPIH
jgi:hypothetical protein